MKSRAKIAITTIMLAAIVSQSFATSKQIGTISNLCINDFAQDRIGYMWIATANGLCRYNGYEYYLYDSNQTDSESLYSNNIKEIKADRDGNIWVVTSRGVCLYNPPMDNFHRIWESTQVAGVVFHDKMAVIYGKRGVVLADRHNGQIIAQRDSSVYHLSVMILDGAKRLWGANTETCELIEFDANVNPIKTISTPRIESYNCAYLNDNGNIWFGTKRGMIVLNPLSGLQESESRLETHNEFIGKLDIRRISKLNTGRILLVSHNRGAYVLNISSNAFRNNIKRYFPAFEDGHISCGYMDKEGNVWLGTHDSGFYVDFTDSKRFVADRRLWQATNGKYINAITANSAGTLWLGSRYAGLMGYHYEEKVVRWYTKANTPMMKQAGSHCVLALRYDSDKNLWVALDSALYVCQTSDYDITRFTRVDTTSNISVLAEDRHKRMWCGSPTGVLIISQGNLLRKLFPGMAVNWISPLSGDRMLVSLKDDDVYTVDCEDLSVSNLVCSNDELSRNYLHNVTFTLEDSRGYIWLGTQEYGLVRYIPQNNVLKCYNTTDGLSNNTVESILEDNKASLWICTAYGLSCMNVKTEQFHNYYEYDGFQSNQFCHGSAFKSWHSYLYMGGNKGISRFNPQQMTISERPMPIIFERLEVNNLTVQPGDNSMLKQHLSQTDKIVLRWKQNNFRIYFCSIAFLLPEKISYAYRLKEVDNQWNNIGHVRSVGFSHLPAGNYTFEVIATNSDGVWNKEPISMKITVKPSPWRSWWAVTGYIIIIMAAAWFLIRTYLNNRLQRYKLQQAHFELDKEREMSNMKVNFFANLSHELRTPLSMIYGPVNMLLTNHDPHKAQLYVNLINYNIQRLLSLIDQMLDLSRIDNDTLSLKVTREDIVPMLTAMMNSFEYYAREKNIELRFEVDQQEMIVAVDNDKLNKITSNLISNALKYTPEGGHIEVTVALSDQLPDQLRHIIHSEQYLVVSVTDDGIGMDEADVTGIFERYIRLNKEHNNNVVGSGIGLHYVKQLTLIHKGDVFAQVRPSGGMQFVFAIPVDDSLYTIEQETMVKDSVPQKFIPIAAPVELSDEHSSDEQEPMEESQKPLVVFAEDNVELRTFCTQQMTDTYRVLTASNGRQALALIKENMPDMVITDVMMPLMDGFELCKQIKSNSLLCHIPVIILSAKATDGDKIEGFGIGADSYLTKPFNPELLLTVMHNLLSSRKRLRDSLLGNTTLDLEEGAPSQELSKMDKAFLDKLYKCIDREISNPDFNVNALGKELGMSRTSFYRKIKSLTGITPNDFLRIYRLNKAAELIRRKEMGLSEIADNIGFGTQSYFSRSFKKHFGVSPKNFV